MKTAKQSKKSTQTPKRRRRRPDLDEDVPTCHSPSINEIERDLGHGFWGNQSSGYIYDKDNR